VTTSTSTSLTGLLYGNGSAVSAATATQINTAIGNNNKRTICYVAGSDNGGTLDTTYSQKSFFFNLIGNMTPLPGSAGLTCQTNAGTATIQINKNGGAAGSLSPTLACTTAFNENTPGSWPYTIGANDELDFSIIATSGANRITVCIGATVN
jgi:hypothetical protein